MIIDLHLDEGAIALTSPPITGGGYGYEKIGAAKDECQPQRVPAGGRALAELPRAALLRPLLRPS